MIVLDRIADLREAIVNFKSQGKTIGFVPTMGSLHKGHLSLMKRAVQENDLLVTSIFVNPKQFGPAEDFDKYPRDHERDLDLCRQEEVDLVFLAREDEFYPENYLTYVRTEGITEGLCGRTRPGHFQGVTTVLTKFFNLVEPNRAYFGRKDAQQLIVVRKMVEDLNFPIEIIACETEREEDGLARSSRNIYLSQDERKDASLIYRSLLEAREKIEAGDYDINSIRKLMEEIIERGPSNKIDYIEFVDSSNLERLGRVELGRTLIALAVNTGKTHLIDNIFI